MMSMRCLGHPRMHEDYVALRWSKGVWKPVTLRVTALGLDCLVAGGARGAQLPGSTGATQHGLASRV